MYVPIKEVHIYILFVLISLSKSCSLIVKVYYRKLGIYNCKFEEHV